MNIQNQLNITIKVYDKHGNIKDYERIEQSANDGHNLKIKIEERDNQWS